jgi:dsDNA-specific endonuclease/ATPase MutS2
MNTKKSIALAIATLIAGAICFATYRSLKTTLDTQREELQALLKTTLENQQKEFQELLKTAQDRQQEELRTLQKQLSTHEAERAKQAAQKAATTQEPKTPEQILDPWETPEALRIRQDQEYQRPINNPPSIH